MVPGGAQSISDRVWIWTHPNWEPKNWCLWSVVLEKTLESPLDSMEIKPINPKGNQPWIFIAKTDAEAEAPIHCPPDAKSGLIGKDPDAGKDRSQEEKGMIADEMVGWHHWLNGREFKQALGNGEGQGSLACCSPWGGKELDTTEQLNKSGSRACVLNALPTFQQGCESVTELEELGFVKFFSFVFNVDHF